MNRRALSEEQLNMIRESVRNILLALGEDPEREGLLDTPDRVARMYDEVFEGIRYTNEEIAEMFDRHFETATDNELVVMKDIRVFSYCEHHMALMYNMLVHIAYLPKGRVLGLSKLARIADMVCRRLQLQERITSDIAEILKLVLKTEDVMVVVEAEHSCMTARGIHKPGTVTATRVVSGAFAEKDSLRSEVYGILHGSSKNTCIDG
ncbi:MAG: GTP cyclohydrolase I FolE [Lachnospiraceae bacterium]|nr:GTP cyclohydrolase I FolE [Lachnospiraceae bacterium]